MVLEWKDATPMLGTHPLPRRAADIGGLTMKLGEVLALRADLQKRMQQVQKMLLENATLQEGDTPTIDPARLLEQYRQLADEHERVVRRINRANVLAQVVFAGEAMSLADAVVRRERLARHAGVLRDLTARAMPERNRFLRTEVKHVPAFDVTATLAHADRLSREHRELDTTIQQANWEVDITE